MNKNVIEKKVKCKFCQSYYIEKHKTWEIIDWHGHNPKRTGSSITPKKCPHCNDDVIKAAQIVKKREIYIEEKYKKDVKKYNKLYLYSAKYSNSNKRYDNISRKKMENGTYYYKKNNQYQYIVVNLFIKKKKELTDDIENNKKIMKQTFNLYDCSHVKPIKFNVKKIKNKLIKNIQNDIFQKPPKINLYELLETIKMNYPISAKQMNKYYDNFREV